MVKYSEVFKILIFFGGCVLRSGDVEKLDVTVAGLHLQFGNNISTVLKSIKSSKNALNVAKIQL